MDVDQSNELYKRVGFALTRWALVEQALCAVFCNCINHHQANPADKAFWTVQSFDGKLSMTTAVLQDRFTKFLDGSNDDLLNRWSNLHNRLKRHNTKRNHLAHGSVVNLCWNSLSERQEDTFFAPFYQSRNARPVSHAEYIARDGDNRPKERYYSHDLKDITATFVEDEKRLYAIASEVRDRLIDQERLEQGT